MTEEFYYNSHLRDWDGSYHDVLREINHIWEEEQGVTHEADDVDRILEQLGYDIETFSPPTSDHEQMKVVGDDIEVKYDGEARENELIAYVIPSKESGTSSPSPHEFSPRDDVLSRQIGHYFSDLQHDITVEA